MIDNDDVGFVALLFSDFRGPIGFLVFVVMVCTFGYYACRNSDECEAKKCPNAQHAKLLDHRCVCVTEAK